MAELDPELQPETVAVHAARRIDPATGAVAEPIHLSTTFQRGPDGDYPTGFSYSRSDNPNRAALEHALAIIEGGADAAAFASGLAAATAVFQTLAPNDHVIAPIEVYHGVMRLLRTLFVPWGLRVDFVDMPDLDAIKKTVNAQTKLIWVETPSNPLLKLIDLAAVAKIAREANAIAVADNTFASPWGQNPLAHGFDIVAHSTTKYLNGHSDVVGGLVVVGKEPRQAEWAERLAFLHNAVGAIAGPFDSFLALRGVKTLALRMERHNASALALAQWLEAHPKVERVYYPGLESHPQHALGKRQMRGGGGMISMDLKSDLAGSKRFLEALHYFALAESLGGVESLIEHPAIMTHASIPAEQRARLGIGDTLIRLSVGIEALDDLKADLQTGFNRI